jgi:hypothetical protein
MAVDTAYLPRVRERVRWQPLKLPVIPVTLIAQAGGGVAALGGVYMAFGTAVTLMVGGVASVVLGALREAGKI